MTQAFHAGFKTCFMAVVLFAGWLHLDPSFIVDPMASAKAASALKFC
jgi:hypothetical protein